MIGVGECGVDLYWLPLGAGGRWVRLYGRVFEAVVARVGRRAPCDLYHSALVVQVPSGRFVIEQGPIPDAGGAARGVVAEGVFVGSGIFKSEDPARMANAIVHATTNFDNPKILADVSAPVLQFQD